jgi:predicted CXXCH cytochrome family protein
MLKLTTSILALLLCISSVAVASNSGPLNFDHQPHAEEDLNCADCHQWSQGRSIGRAAMPDRGLCLDCHEDDDLPAIPDFPVSHLENFRFAHQFSARNQGDDCAICHRESESCSVCHHGETVDFIAHDRNWRYNHPLIYYKGTEDCATCHEPRAFCSGCHEENGIRPANHYYTQWTSPLFHGEEAKIDLETCVQCHEGSEPLCIQCHGELDP